jgi:hypothetical protein
MKQKFIENHHYAFSQCFDESTTTETLYENVAKPLVLHAMSNGGESVIMMYSHKNDA